jgi:hypothetical protein
MPGDGTWQLRELRVPDPPPGGAVLRVEAVPRPRRDPPVPADDRLNRPAAQPAI